MDEIDVMYGWPIKPLKIMDEELNRHWLWAHVPCVFFLAGAVLGPNGFSCYRLLVKAG
jgi:hypothetical protein